MMAYEYRQEVNREKPSAPWEKTGDFNESVIRSDVVPGLWFGFGVFNVFEVFWGRGRATISEQLIEFVHLRCSLGPAAPSQQFRPTCVTFDEC